MSAPSTGDEVLDGILARMTGHRVQSWSSTYVEPVPSDVETSEQDLSRADVVSSELKDAPGLHILALDIDHPSVLVKSTNGNAHLYVDLPPISTKALADFLDAAAKIGLIEEGYAGASKRRGYTSLRPPWLKKGRPILRCIRCGKRPDELPEYVDGAKDAAYLTAGPAGVTPDDYAWSEEGTLDRKTGDFACTKCYIELGQPSGYATQWKASMPTDVSTLDHLDMGLSAPPVKVKAEIGTMQGRTWEDLMDPDLIEPF